MSDPAAHTSIVAELPSGIGTLNSVIQGLLIHSVCFSIEVGPLPILVYHIDLTKELEIGKGPDRRRSGPHYPGRLELNFSMLSPFQGGVPVLCRNTASWAPRPKFCFSRIISTWLRSRRLGLGNQ
jgi:hypothetical protein